MTKITTEVLVTEFFKVTKERIVSFYLLKEIAKEYARINEGVEVDYTKASLRKVAIGNPDAYILKGDYIITKKALSDSQTPDNNPITNSIANITTRLLA